MLNYLLASEQVGEPGCAVSTHPDQLNDAYLGCRRVYLTEALPMETDTDC